MKIRTVNYSQSRETLHGFGLKKWDKIGMDIELEDGDTPDKAYALAHQFVTEKLNQNQIQEQEMKGSHTVDIGEKIDERPLIEQINSCTDIEVLGSYKVLVRNDEVLNTAFRNKLIELSNPKQ